MEIIEEVWRRAVSIQPVPPAGTVAALALAALVAVLVPALWRVTRMMVTITHEGGHAIAAVLAGRRLRGIRVHSDTSGLTVSKGRASGPGMVMMLAAGYLGPALVGLGAALLLVAGRSVGLLWLLLAVLGLMLLQIRNAYGFAVLAGGGLLMLAVTWYLSPTAQSAVAYLITWTLLIAAPKPVLELMAQRRRGGRGTSDADQLARLTSVPGVIWTWLFLAANTAGLAVGVALLLPRVATALVTTVDRLAGQ